MTGYTTADHFSSASFARPYGLCQMHVSVWFAMTRDDSSCSLLLLVLLPLSDSRLDGVDWREPGMRQVGSSDGAASLASIKPLLNVDPVVGLPIRSHHWIFHHLLQHNTVTTATKCSKKVLI